MKLRDYLAVAAETIPLLLGCMGVIGGGYLLLCTAPEWIGYVTDGLVEDIIAVAVAGIGMGFAAAAVTAAAGRCRRQRLRRAANRDARCLGYVSAEDICRAAKNNGGMTK